MSSHRVVVVLFGGFQLLDLAGPADVFSTARLLDPCASYEVEVTAIGAGAVRSLSGVTVTVETPIGAVAGPIDTLLVVGGLPTRTAVADTARLIPDVRRLAGESRRFGSICSGTLLLAEAGLLNGRRVTTHWAAQDTLAREHPDIHVDADRIYVHDGNVWTSAGVTSGIDLALALVAHDHGHRPRTGDLPLAHRLPAATRRPEPVQHAAAAPRHLSVNPCASCRYGSRNTSMPTCRWRHSRHA